MPEISNIVLKANVGDIQNASAELDKFADKAQKAGKSADDLNSSFRSGAQGSKQNAQSLKDQQQELQNLLNRINPTNKAFEQLDKITAQLSAANKSGLLPTDQFRDYSAILDQTRAQLQRTQSSMTAEGRALMEQESATKRAAQAGQSFIDSLQDQSNAINKTRSEILEMKAAQMGVSTQAAPLIAKLREQENAWKSGTISAGQYRQAMRQLPMQITDVVTSLASGMPIYMVAIQQGGQIKDSFGGIGNAAKALVSAISPIAAIFGVGAAAIGALALAAYQGADEIEQLNKSLILTGNYAGATGGQLQSMAAKIASATNTTQHSAVSTLATLNNTGKYTSQQLETVGTAIQNMSRTGAISTEELIKQFQSLGEDPVSAIVKLNDQYNFLTTSTYQQIKALEDQGDIQGATTLAMNTYADTVNQRSGQITQNLGYMETAWNSIKSAAASAWDTMLNAGRSETLEDKLAAAQARAKQQIVQSTGVPGGEGYIVSDSQRKEAQSTANTLQSVVNLNNDITKALSEQSRISKESISDLNTLDGYEKNAKTNAEKRVTEYERINKLLKEGVITEQQAAQYRAAVDTNLKDPSSRKSSGGRTSTYSDDAATKELQASQQRLAVMRQQTEQTETMTDGERRLLAFNQQITDLKSKGQLTADQKSILANQEAIRSSLQQEASLSRQIEQRKTLNSYLATADKYVTQQTEKSSLERSNLGTSSRQSSLNAQLAQLDIGFQNNAASKLTGSEYDEAIAGLERMKKAAKDSYDQQTQDRLDWQSGAKSGFAEFAENATDMYGQIKTVSENAFTGLATTLTNFFTTGKASVEDFLTTFLTGIVQITTQLALLNSIKAATSGTSIGSFFGFASGGAVGYTGDGGKYEPKGVVHGGEFVFTKEATKSIGIDTLYAVMRNAQGYASGGYVGTAPMYGLTSGSSSSGVSVYAPVTIEQQSGSGDVSATNTANTASQLQGIIQTTISDRLKKEMSPGGLLYSR